MSQLISDIIKKLFYGDARLVIVTNRDGFVWSHRREIESEYGKPVRIFAGKASTCDLYMKLICVKTLIQDFSLSQTTT